MLELSLLHHFIAVAHARSFTSAAKELATSQPVISRSIQRLEDIVGTTLIERSTRSLALTPAGEALLKDAIEIVGKAALATAKARTIGQGELARLRVGICPTAESAELSKGIGHFRLAWPKIELRFVVIASDQMPEALHSARVDIGIMQLEGLSFGGLKGKIIASHQLAVAVPAAWGYPDRPIKLIDLKDRPWVMPERSKATLWYDSLLEMCHRAGFDPKIVGAVDDPLTARIMIGSGAGATFFHDKGRRNWDTDIQLLTFTDPQIPPPSRTAVVYAQGDPSSQIQGFIDIVAAAQKCQPDAADGAGLG
jgi:DNA-binding transcriptional LysR family regulator